MKKPEVSRISRYCILYFDMVYKFPMCRALKLANYRFSCIAQNALNALSKLIWSLYAPRANRYFLVRISIDYSRLLMYGLASTVAASVRTESKQLRTAPIIIILPTRGSHGNWDRYLPSGVSCSSRVTAPRSCSWTIEASTLTLDGGSMKDWSVNLGAW